MEDRTVGGWVSLKGRSLNGNERNRLYLNPLDPFRDGDRSGQRWAQVAYQSGSDRIEDGRACALADFDGDGRLDIVVQNYKGPSILMTARGGDGHYLAVDLVGSASNRDAIGAVVRARVGGRVLRRDRISSAGYLAGQPGRLHFGLGPHGRVDELVVTWPSGRTTTLASVPVNRVLRLVEPER